MVTVFELVLEHVPWFALRGSATSAPGSGCWGCRETVFKLPGVAPISMAEGFVQVRIGVQQLVAAQVTHINRDIEANRVRFQSVHW